MCDIHSSRRILTVCLFIFVLCFNVRYSGCVSNHPIIFVISVDAFRHDYVEDCLTPTICTLRKQGVYAPYMKNVFPTKTLPNHHSIATGVYPEVHGVLDSEVYMSKDGCSNRSVVGYSYELFHDNNDILPIWTLNELAGGGRHSGVMMWPGGEYSYGCKKTLPTFYKKLDFSVSFEQRIDIIMSWFTHNQTAANLVFLYLEEPDLHGHAFGIDSPEVHQQIKKVDRTLQYVDQKLHEHNLHDLVNVFVLSDHGMINLDQRNIIDLNPFVNNSLYVAASHSPALQVFPNDGYENTVYCALLVARQENKNAFEVYRRDEIPEVWHYRHNNRTPPILVVAKEGFAFQDMVNTINKLNKQFNIETNPRNKYGVHGYSNDIQTMFPFFFAWGPLIKVGVKIDPFDSVGLYSLWGYILQLNFDHHEYSEPLLGMLLNGSQTHTLLPAPSSFKTAATWTYWVAGILAFGVLVAIIGIITHFFKENRYRTGFGPSFHSLRKTKAASLISSSESEDDQAGPPC